MNELLRDAKGQRTMKIKGAILVLLCLSLFALNASAQDGQLSEHDQKMMNPSVVDKCMNMEHSQMMSCILKAMKSAQYDTPVPSKKSAASKAPRKMKRKKNPIKPDEKSLTNGKAFYYYNCSSCHGVMGHGDGPLAKQFSKTVADLTSPRLKKVSDGALLWKITEGGWPMPAFGYQEEWTETDLWDVINYIRSLSKH